MFLFLNGFLNIFIAHFEVQMWKEGAPGAMCGPSGWGSTGEGYCLEELPTLGALGQQNIYRVYLFNFLFLLMGVFFFWWGGVIIGLLTSNY